jgi:hypothetical protein
MRFTNTDSEIIIEPNNIKLIDIISDIKLIDIDTIKSKYQLTSEEWSYISKRIYDDYYQQAKAKREEELNNPNIHIIATSNEDIGDMIDTNNKLIDLALAMPTFCTIPEFRFIKSELEKQEINKDKVIQSIKKITMEPRIRAMQQIGRFEKIPLFSEFSKIINAGLLSYYRGNYISAYMTLVPVIEGIILRWYGYPNKVAQKPQFDKIKSFIRKTYQRQPMPDNILFMEVFSKAADKIFIEHFFKPSTSGEAYENFNRHLASHFLNSNAFITEDNILRLFILLDLISEIYIYEAYHQDPRFNLSNEEIKPYIDIYQNAMYLRKMEFLNLEEKLNLHTQ